MELRPATATATATATDSAAALPVPQLLAPFAATPAGLTQPTSHTHPHPPLDRTFSLDRHRSLWNSRSDHPRPNALQTPFHSDTSSGRGFRNDFRQYHGAVREQWSTGCGRFDRSYDQKDNEYNMAGRACFFSRGRGRYGRGRQSNNFRSYYDFSRSLDNSRHQPFRADMGRYDNRRFFEPERNIVDARKRYRNEWEVFEGAGDREFFQTWAGDKRLFEPHTRNKRPFELHNEVNNDRYENKNFPEIHKSGEDNSERQESKRNERREKSDGRNMSSSHRGSYDKNDNRRYEREHYGKGKPEKALDGKCTGSSYYNQSRMYYGHDDKRTRNDTGSRNRQGKTHRTDCTLREPPGFECKQQVKSSRIDFHSAHASLKQSCDNEEGEICITPSRNDSSISSVKCLPNKELAGNQESLVKDQQDEEEMEKTEDGVKTQIATDSRRPDTVAETHGSSAKVSTLMEKSRKDRIESQVLAASRRQDKAHEMKDSSVKGSIEKPEQDSIETQLHELEKDDILAASRRQYTVGGLQDSSARRRQEMIGEIEDPSAKGSIEKPKEDGVESQLPASSRRQEIVDKMQDSSASARQDIVGKRQGSLAKDLMENPGQDGTETQLPAASRRQEGGEMQDSLLKVSSKSDLMQVALVEKNGFAPSIPKDAELKERQLVAGESPVDSLRTNKDVACSTVHKDAKFMVSIEREEPATGENLDDVLKTRVSKEETDGIDSQIENQQFLRALEGAVPTSASELVTKEECVDLFTRETRGFNGHIDSLALISGKQIKGGPMQEIGESFKDSSMRPGKRGSSATSYEQSNKRRKNLVISSHAMPLGEQSTRERRQALFIQDSSSEGYSRSTGKRDTSNEEESNHKERIAPVGTSFKDDSRKRDFPAMSMQVSMNSLRPVEVDTRREMEEDNRRFNSGGFPEDKSRKRHSETSIPFLKVVKRRRSERRRKPISDSMSNAGEPELKGIQSGHNTEEVTPQSDRGTEIVGGTSQGVCVVDHNAQVCSEMRQQPIPDIISNAGQPEVKGIQSGHNIEKVASQSDRGTEIVVGVSQVVSVLENNGELCSHIIVAQPSTNKEGRDLVKESQKATGDEIGSGLNEDKRKEGFEACSEHLRTLTSGLDFRGSHETVAAVLPHLTSTVPSLNCHLAECLPIDPRVPETICMEEGNISRTEKDGYSNRGRGNSMSVVHVGQLHMPLGHGQEQETLETDIDVPLRCYGSSIPAKSILPFARDGEKEWFKSDCVGFSLDAETSEDQGRPVKSVSCTHHRSAAVSMNGLEQEEDFQFCMRTTEEMTHEKKQMVWVPFWHWLLSKEDEFKAEDVHEQSCLMFGGDHSPGSTGLSHPTYEMIEINTSGSSQTRDFLSLRVGEEPGIGCEQREACGYSQLSPGIFNVVNKMVPITPSSCTFGLHEIAMEPILGMAQKLQELPEGFLDSLRGLTKKMLESIEMHETFLFLQSTIKNRTDLREETLLLAHRLQLEVLVSLKTGMQTFLEEGSRALTYKVLIEIFLHLRCQNLDCKQLLPADSCKCRLCSKKSGFCCKCMCMACNKFDQNQNTCRWVECEACSHWCHAECALRKSYIGPVQLGQIECGELQFECPACGHYMELYGFVKRVFDRASRVWGVETYTKELEYVRMLFYGSEDLRGKQLRLKAEQILQKLEKMANGTKTCSNMIQSFL